MKLPESTPWSSDDLSIFSGSIGGPRTVKDTNPKDEVGSTKPPFSTVSGVVIAQLGLAMEEGARKYGKHNYRVAGVRSSVYVDATMRHLMQWWEGEDIDPDSGLNHIIKAIASLTVLADAIYNDKLNDDRPPALKKGWLRDLQKQMDELRTKYPKPVAPFTENNNG